MFGKKKLSQEGTEARAVVVEAAYHSVSDIGLGGISDESHEGNKYRVTVRVTFEDGSTAEMSAHLRQSEVGALHEGDIVPVRYDPADRSKLEIDDPALRAQHAALEDQRAAARAKLKELAIARAERELQGEPTTVQTTRRIGELMRELIKAQQAGDEAEMRRIQDEIAGSGKPGSTG